MKMRCLKLNLLVTFLFPLFLTFSTSFYPSHGASQDHFIHPFQDAKIPEILDVNTQHHGNVEWNTRRIAAETTQNSTYLVLAANRTHRRDPSDDFNFYTGGWNITDSHYLFSVAFSAAGPIVFAIVWFLVFGICLLCLCICCCCCCRRKSYGYSKTAYAISITCLSLFTLAAIAGIVFLHLGQEGFENSIVDTVSFVLHKADTVILNLKDLLDNLLAARNSSVGRAVLPKELQTNIDDIQKTIDDVTGQFRNVTKTNSQDIHHFLDPLYYSGSYVSVLLIQFLLDFHCSMKSLSLFLFSNKRYLTLIPFRRLTLIVFSSALLILAFLGYLCSILGLQCVIYIFVIIGWILVALTFILSGMFLLVHNVATDTCFAIGEWLQNPDAHSALESIIPKVDNQTAEDISSATKGVTLGLITMVNVQIANVSNVDMPPNAGPLYYNQSGPLVPVLCSPYGTHLTDRQCAAGEVSLNNASLVWRNYVCQTSASGNCATTGRITPNAYNQMMTVVNVSHALYTDMPFLVDLMDSTYLKELFSEISKDYCPNLEVYTEWMYTGFITSSVAVMLSLILWIIYARERRHRKYTKKIDSRSPAGIPSGYRQYP